MRAAAAVGAILAVALIAAFATRGSSAPADRADNLVPADALVYVHFSTDPDRDADRRLLARARKLPAYPLLLARVKRALAGLDPTPWLGDEAAFAATPAGSLVLLAVSNDAKARKAVAARHLPAGTASFTGGFLAVGTPLLVAQARALRAGHGESLAALPAYAAAADERPDDRSVDAWADPRAAGLLLGTQAGALLGGRSVQADVTATDAGVRVRARRIGGAANADFAPGLLKAVPDDAFAYLGLRGLRTLGRLIPAAATQAVPGALTGQLAPLADAVTGEVAVSVAPGPTVTLVARTDDASAARTALAGLQGTAAAALTGAGEATGQVPVFEERDLGRGIDGYALTLAGGGELVYAVAGDRVAISNSEPAVSRALHDADGLGDAEGFANALPDVPDTAQALAFVASSQLLELADEAGLGALAIYRTVRPSLARIRALGAVVRRQGNDTTAELNLLIP